MGTGCSSIGVPVAVAFTVAIDSDKATSIGAPVPDKIRAIKPLVIAGILAFLFIHRQCKPCTGAGLVRRCNVCFMIAIIANCPSVYWVLPTHPRHAFVLAIVACEVLVIVSGLQKYLLARCQLPTTSPMEPPCVLWVPSFSPRHTSSFIHIATEVVPSHVLDVHKAAICQCSVILDLPIELWILPS